tara:strand:- start:124 stop:462 length:339 start_codon:yes stop_codon:yes gene_type:complete
MKLKVAETMDVEEIPQKLAEMMEQIKKSVVTELTLCDPVASAIVSAATQGDDLAAARAHVLSMRSHLYNIDVKLEDIAMILGGLEKILEEQTASTSPSSTLVPGLENESDDS